MRSFARRWPYVVALLVAAGLVGACALRVRALLETTLLVAAGAAAIATPLGGLAAVLIEKTNAPARRLAHLLLLAMLFVPMQLHAAAWQAGFGILGWFTERTGGGGPSSALLQGPGAAIWVHGVAAVAWVTLIVRAGLQSVDPRLEEHALLHAHAERVLWSVSLRHAAPWLLVGAGWVGVMCASEIAVTDLFMVRTFAEEVYTQAVLGLFDPLQVSDERPVDAVGLAAGVALVAVVATGVLFVAGDVMAAAAGGHALAPWRWVLARGRSAAGALLLAALALVAAVPLGNLVYKAGATVTREEGAWRRDWSLTKAAREVAAAPARHPREFWQSAKLGTGVATAAVLVGGAIAWRLARRPVERWVWLPLLGVCLAIPGPLLGVWAIRVLNRPPDSPLWLLSWLYDRTLFAPWLVQMVRATPIAALVLWPVWRSVPPSVLDAAAADGVGPVGRVWRIAAPMRLPALCAAWLAALAVSFGELSGSILVLPPGPQTITCKVFGLLHYGVDDRVASICLVLIAVFAAIAWGASALWMHGLTLARDAAAGPQKR